MKSTPLILDCGSGSIRSLHAHRNAGLEIVYLQRGVLEWAVEGQVETVFPGAIFFTLPWETHGSVKAFEPGHLWHYAILRLLPDKLNASQPFSFPEELGFSEIEGDRLCKVLRGARQRSYLATTSLAAHIIALSKRGDNLNEWSSRKQACIVALVLMELAETITANRSKNVREADAFRVEKVVKALRAKPEHGWTLEEICRIAKLRKSHFTEIFTRQTGDSFTRFVQRMRVDIARKMLITTDKDITTVAFDCGFSSSHYFALLFRRFTGMTASEFRLRDPASADRRRES